MSKRFEELDEDEMNDLLTSYNFSGQAREEVKKAFSPKKAKKSVSYGSEEEQPTRPVRPIVGEQSETAGGPVETPEENAEGVTPYSQIGTRVAKPFSTGIERDDPIAPYKNKKSHHLSGDFRRDKRVLAELLEKAAVRQDRHEERLRAAEILAEVDLVKNQPEVQYIVNRMDDDWFDEV